MLAGFDRDPERYPLRARCGGTRGPWHADAGTYPASPLARLTGDLSFAEAVAPPSCASFQLLSFEPQPFHVGVDFLLVLAHERYALRQEVGEFPLALCLLQEAVHLIHQHS